MTDEILAKNLMTIPVRKLSTCAQVRDAARFLLEWGISGAPVLNEDGRWVGVFTLNDLARHVQDRLVKLPVIDPENQRALETREPLPEGFNFEAFEDTVVGDLVMFGLYTVFPDATMEVVRTMASQKIHRVFVIDGGEIVGVITTMDLIKWMVRKFKACQVPLRQAV